MTISPEQLFSYRQYTGQPPAYCFDTLTYTFCDVSYLQYEPSAPHYYERYVPLFQIDETALQARFIRKQNNTALSRAFTAKTVCFEAFVHEQNLWDDWWEYYKACVYSTAVAWSEAHGICIRK